MTTSLKYFELLKLHYPLKTPTGFTDETYEGINWNVFDTTPNPTQQELDALRNPLIPVQDIIGSLVTVGIRLNAISGISIMPFDNTTPLITDGTQVASVIIKPSSLNSKLKIEGALQLDCNSNNKNIIVGLFKGNDCIGANTVYFDNSGKAAFLPFCFTDLAICTSGTLCPVTYSVRIGASAPCVWYINRLKTPALNGMMGSNSIIFTEYL